MNKIGEKIRKIRESKNLSQENVALELGISQPNYVRLEKNGDKITISKLIAIAKIFETSVAELIGEEAKKVYIVENNNDNAHAYFDTVIHKDKEHIESLKSEIAFLRKILEQR